MNEGDTTKTLSYLEVYNGIKKRKEKYFAEK